MMTIGERKHLQALLARLRRAEGMRIEPADRSEASIMAIFAGGLLEGSLQYANARPWIAGVEQALARWEDEMPLHPDDGTCCCEGEKPLQESAAGRSRAQ